MPCENVQTMPILSSQRFLPLFITQFLGAFNDNLFKNALVILITYRVTVETGQNAQILITLAAGLFILPFFIFSATAGQFADKYDRAWLSRIIKIAEIMLMVLAAAGLWMGNVIFLMLVLFCTGVQATFFGPIKYALLPQHLKENELLPGNAYIEAGTFLAILLGTILGGSLILHKHGIAEVSVAAIVCAIAGYIASRHIPPAPPPEPQLCINYNIVREIMHIIRFARADRNVFLYILGISWFWLLGATFLSQFPTYAKDVVYANQKVVTLFLTLFSVGIGTGSLLCNTLLKGKLDSRYVPFAMIGISLFTFDLYYSSGSAVFAADTTLSSIPDFLWHAEGWRILADLFFIALCGGIFIVPLYALMQIKSPAEHRARIIAANNIMNALFMVVAALLTSLMLEKHWTVPEVFLSTGILNIPAAIYMFRFLTGRRQ